MSFDFKKEPIENFLKLYKEAQVKGVPEANAMALATVNAEKQPSVRIVFYKMVIDGGFCFFTNYQGRKARDIEANNKVSANFFWPNLDQQVRVEGLVHKTSREISEKYFATRARLSQIGAWASHQSEEIESFDAFSAHLRSLEKSFEGKPVPCPPHWGGYRIEPNEIEFWFGKNGRLHERFVYQRQASGWRHLLRSP
jgi:pyridoxamine 5'-phosphate oxidase